MANLRVLGGFVIDQTALPAAAILQNSGIVDLTVAPVDNGVGDWTVNLRADKGIDQGESFSCVTVQGTAPLEVALEHVSDTAKRLRVINNAAAATDAVLSVVFFGRDLV